MQKDNKQTERKQSLRLLKPILIFPVNVLGVIPALILWFSGNFETLKFKIFSLTFGGLLMGVGFCIAWRTVSLFVKVGKGTPAPWDPPQNLVIEGIYKYVRNPMMMAVWCILIGESILFLSLYIFLWFLVFFILSLTLVPLLEEPQLERRFGEAYKKYKVQPYLDHTYFMKAYEVGAVDKAIVLGKELGFEYIEFMSTYKDVPEEDLFRWRKLSKELGLNMFYEHHPKRNWFKSSDEESSAFADIISMAKPFIDDGAIMLVLDHEEFELQNNEGKVNYKEIIDYFGKEKICFEITSPKEGNERCAWLD